MEINSSSNDWFTKFNISTVGAIITANILTIVGIGLCVALYKLSGDYLNTFLIMIMFTIALTTIRNTVIQSFEDAYQTNRARWQKHKIYILHSAKFSLVFKTLINIILCLTSFTQLKKNIMWILNLVFQISFIPIAFCFYMVTVKLEILPQILILDFSFWIIIDLIRLISYPFKKLLTKKNVIQNQDPEKNQKDGLLEWIKTSSLFNQMLFYSVMIGLVLVLPIVIVFIYSDIQTYKNDLIPKLQNYSIPEQYSNYLTTEFMLQQLQGNYLSEQTIQQLYNYLNSTKNAPTISEPFLEIFYGYNAPFIYNNLVQCNESLYCQAMIFGNNLNMINSEIYEYSTNGLNYLKTIMPQIQSFAAIIAQFLVGIFQNSIAFLVKFIIFQQGVLYLITQQGLKVENLVIFKLSQSFRNVIVENIKTHISGVFVSLFSIFIYHFMLTYLFLDILNIKLAFIQGMIIGLLSLTQIIDPGITFILLVCVWQIAETIHQGFVQWMDPNKIYSLILCLSFYFISGNIYLHIFKKQLGDAYWSGMALVLGYIAFQWQGLIYGPLLIGASRTFIKIIVWYMNQEEKQEQSKISKIQPKSEQIIQDSIGKKDKKKSKP